MKNLLEDSCLSSFPRNIPSEKLINERRVKKIKNPNESEIAPEKIPPPWITITSKMYFSGMLDAKNEL